MVSPVKIRRPIGDRAPAATLYYGAPNVESLRKLPDGSVHTVVTSPPYWGLRDYGGEPLLWGADPDCEHEWGDELPHGRRGNRGTSGAGGNKHPSLYEAGQAAGSGGGGQFCQRCAAWRGQFGLEPTPELFIEHLVEIFREVRRVLRDDGTLWLNLGDSYAGAGPSGASYQSETTRRRAEQRKDGNFSISKSLGERGLSYADKKPVPPPGLKSKDLVGVPWMAAFALRSDGWYLRSDVIWAKPSCMPESVRDRPTKSHEYLFLLSKSQRYFYDADAIREPLTMTPQRRLKPRDGEQYDAMRPDKKYDYDISDEPYQQGHPGGRNKRTVWTVNPKPYPGAHFAVFPPELIMPCVLAGSSERGCCPACGAPWERRFGESEESPATTAKRLNTRDEQREYFEAKGGSGGTSGSTRPTGYVAPKIRKLLGWVPACGCPEHEPVPCVVLDPFSGSGTAGQVALDNGRAYVGLDLSTEYLDLARARILGERPPKPEPEEADQGILGMLRGED